MYVCMYLSVCVQTCRHVSYVHVYLYVCECKCAHTHTHIYIHISQADVCEQSLSHKFSLNFSFSTAFLGKTDQDQLKMQFLFCSHRL
jgi:hypothetical protein